MNTTAVPTPTPVEAARPAMTQARFNAQMSTFRLHLAVLQDAPVPDVAAINAVCEERLRFERRWPEFERVWREEKWKVSERVRSGRRFFDRQEVGR
jgi:hypothetical protein